MKVLRRPELPAVEHRRPVGIRAEARKPLEEPLNRDAHLDPREVMTRAEVGAEPEGSVVAPGAEEVVGGGRRPPDILVPIGGRDERSKVCTDGQRDAAELRLDENDGSASRSARPTAVSSTASLTSPRGSAARPAA